MVSRDTSSEAEDAEDDTDELKWIVQRSIEHLGCVFGALVVPEKGLAICRAGSGANAAESSDVLTRTHRHLLTWARLQGKIDIDFDTARRLFTLLCVLHQRVAAR